MTGLTWRQLAQYILEIMPDRFLDTPVEVYDCDTGITHVEVKPYADCDDEDFVIDIDQPQLFINYEED